MRTHYIGTDDAREIAARARALRDGVPTLHVIERGEERDPLADIAAALDDSQRVPTTDVLKRLAALNGDAYGTWTNGDLKRVLDAHGAEPYKSDGRMVVARERVHRALANRDSDGSVSAAGRGRRTPAPDLHK